MSFCVKLLFFLILSSPVYSEEMMQILIPGPRSNHDVSHDYHIQLLKIALANAGVNPQRYVIQVVPNVSEGRAIVELKKGQLMNLYWLGADKKLAQDLLPIEVPTTRGLIGYRKLLIAKNRIDDFRAIKSLADLKNKTACLGEHWPDREIFQTAGLKTITSVHYEALFKMLALGRCDYFPRGYHDFKQELIERAEEHPDLVGFDDIMLHYPFAVFFYVSKSAPELAKALDRGLRIAAKRGQIQALMQRHALTKSVFPLSAGKPKLYFQVPNPMMEFSNSANPEFWIRPLDFGIKD